ncbi:hypothetical protein V1517DRAFT_67210 [Lipomyces orientalis]|uniref:Uncharacterized protein n=1 Tax=Lipomyces orientalis TaxID=1233043 RepID=A0ACC3TG64_9ASCO
MLAKSIFGPMAYAKVLIAQSKCSLRTPFRFCIKVCYCDQGYKSIMPEVPATLPCEYIKTPAAPLPPPSGTSSGERTTTPLHCGDGTETGSETVTKWKVVRTAKQDVSSPLSGNLTLNIDWAQLHSMCQSPLAVVVNGYNQLYRLKLCRVNCKVAFCLETTQKRQYDR